MTLVDRFGHLSSWDEGPVVRAAVSCSAPHDQSVPLVEPGSVRAPLEHQLALRAPLGQQVGQALPIALLVHDDAGLVAAGRAGAARAPAPHLRAPGCQEVPRSAAHGALSLVHRLQSPPILSVEHEGFRDRPDGPQGEHLGEDGSCVPCG